MGTVLVIGRDRTIMQGLKDAFTGWRGYDVIQRTSDSAAVADLASGLKIDVALIDDSHADIDGIKVLKSLKLVAPAVPVIMVSSRRSVEDYLRAIAAGAHDCLIGPVNYGLLWRAVSEAVRIEPVRRIHSAQRRSDQRDEGIADSGAAGAGR